MRKEDTKINYRPDLAEILKHGLELANKLYTMNFQQAYYMVLAELERPYDTTLADVLVQLANCFDKSNKYPQDELIQHYEKKYDIPHISEARAAYIIFQIYQDNFNKLQAKINTNDFTICENAMVDRYFRILLSPTINPKLQIPEGETECYYDRFTDTAYDEDIAVALEYIQKECEDIISIFATPDE